MVVIKLLYIFHYSTIAELNEHLVSTVLTFFNIAIIITIIVIRITFKEYEHNPIFIQTFTKLQNEAETEESTRLRFM